jgi:hypothetical protein
MFVLFPIGQSTTIINRTGLGRREPHWRATVLVTNIPVTRAPRRYRIGKKTNQFVRTTVKPLRRVT